MHAHTMFIRRRREQKRQRRQHPITLGLSLQESAELIGMYDPSSNNNAQLSRLIEKIQTRKAQLVAQKLELEQMIDDLDAWEQRSRKSMKSRKAKKV